MSGNDLLEEILGNNNMPSGGTSSGQSNEYGTLNPGETDSAGNRYLGVADPNAEAPELGYDPSLWE